MTYSLLQTLRQEFACRWKLVSAGPQGCDCAAYLDPCEVMERLDDVIGPENWQDHYREVAGRLYCDLSLRLDGEWITKSDCASEDSLHDAGDAFKRAAVKWGIGRFLYSIEPVRLSSVEAGRDEQGLARYEPADEFGRRIQHLSTYLNTLQAQKHAATPAQKEAIRLQCQQRGWSAEQLQKRLQRQQTSWKTLTQSQAARLLDEFETQSSQSGQGHTAPPELLYRSA